ncbi:IQ motif and SEC7 domain-containing protein 1 [Trichinella pseudospiralis]|uniref:IQ motif and SEC7 domain-containing protein 1 n=1 Tax=Trichinella pseudospiralis TaxID=6337 RepID=A0A0V1IY85_TRIPS|nr:IQ motif and SEC7 domain-containing protein 1 [Trichinella pseudospiralis]
MEILCHFKISANICWSHLASRPLNVEICIQKLVMLTVQIRDSSVSSAISQAVSVCFTRCSAQKPVLLNWFPRDAQGDRGSINSRLCFQDAPIKASHSSIKPATEAQIENKRQLISLSFSLQPTKVKHNMPSLKFFNQTDSAAKLLQNEPNNNNNNHRLIHSPKSGGPLIRRTTIITASTTTNTRSSSSNNICNGSTVTNTTTTTTTSSSTTTTTYRYHRRQMIIVDNRCTTRPTCSLSTSVRPVHCTCLDTGRQLVTVNESYALQAEPIRLAKSSKSSSSSSIWLPRVHDHQRQQFISEYCCSRRPEQDQQYNNYSSSASSKTMTHCYNDGALVADEILRKRRYRVAITLFNKRPTQGMRTLIDWGFLAPTPLAVAKFLLTRKGLSKQMIGDYLGRIQDEFCAQVLKCFAREMDLRDMEIDHALRRFLHGFHLPGESQKIERILEAFAGRYCQCNPPTTKQRLDTVFVLAFAIIMLNTDLHSPNVKPCNRMKLEDFVKNLQGVDEGRSLNRTFLAEIYTRIKNQQLRTGADHVSQVAKVERKIIGEKPQLSLPDRRLICYIRLSQIVDPHRKQSSSAHQRELFLFNDMLLFTKILPKKKSKIYYQYRESYTLNQIQMQPFVTQYYPFGIRLSVGEEKSTLYFNASCAEDRRRFLEDLSEAIEESKEFERLERSLNATDREFKKVKDNKTALSSENRDSGVPDGCGDDSPTSQLGSQACVLSGSLESTKAVSHVSLDSGLLTKVDRLRSENFHGRLLRDKMLVGANRHGTAHWENTLASMSAMAKLRRNFCLCPTKVSTSYSILINS